MEDIQGALKRAVKERVERADRIYQWRQNLITTGRTPTTLAGCTALAREEVRLLKGVKAVNAQGPDGQRLREAREARANDIAGYQQGQGTDYTADQLTGLLKVTHTMARAIKTDIQQLETLDDRNAYTRLYRSVKALCGAVLSSMPPPGLPAPLDVAVMRLYMSVREPVRGMLADLRPYDHRAGTGTPRADETPHSRKGGQRPGSGRKAVGGRRYTFTLSPEEASQVRAFIKSLRSPTV